LEEKSTVLHRMAVMQAAGSEAGDESDPEATDQTRLAAMMPADETQLLYSICLHGRADLGLAPDEYAALTMVLLRLLAFKPSAEKKTLTPAEPRAAALAPAPAAAAPLVPTKPRALQPWDDAPAEGSAAVAISPAVPAQLAPAAPRVAAAASPPATPIAAAVPVASTDGLPAGHMLAVRDSEAPAHTQPPAEEDAPEPEPVRLSASVTRVLAMPVRQQAETHTDRALSPVAPVLLPDEEGDFWHATVQQLVAAEAITAMVRELALQSQLVARDTDQWLLRVERETLNQPGSRERLTQALRNAGFEIKLVVEIGRITDCPARRNAAASEEKQRAAEKVILDDPFVQAMMRDFGAKIVPGSIKPL
jgi:DNA polymerase-3 subunit gamma/tau